MKLLAILLLTPLLSLAQPSGPPGLNKRPSEFDLSELSRLPVLTFEWPNGVTDLTIDLDSLLVVFPKAVTIHIEGTDTTWFVDYTSLVPVIIQALQEHELRIIDLETPGP